MHPHSILQTANCPCNQVHLHTPLTGKESRLKRTPAGFLRIPPSPIWPVDTNRRPLWMAQMCPFTYRGVLPTRNQECCRIQCGVSQRERPRLAGMDLALGPCHSYDAAGQSSSQTAAAEKQNAPGALYIQMVLLSSINVASNH